MENPIVDPSKVQALIAGGLGAFLSVLFQRSSNKLTIFTTLITAEVVCYYCARPVWVVMHGHFAWCDDQWQGPVALSLGLLSIFLVGGVVKMAQDFLNSPWKVIADFFVSIFGRVFGKRER